MNRAEVSTVVFDVDRVILGESPATLEFIAVDLADVITRNLGNHFVVALEYPENPIFVADDRFTGSATLPSMVRTNCANYLFATEWPDNLPSRFLFEIYDGDGDPAAEAAVFDRFLRGSGMF